MLQEMKRFKSLCDTNFGGRSRGTYHVQLGGGDEGVVIDRVTGGGL